MSKSAAFSASFSDCRIVKGRKVLQLCFEVPLEAGDNALSALGGFPRPDKEIWVAIALLDQKAVSEPAKPEKDHRKWYEMPPSQQAAIRCGELGFQLWLSSREEPKPGEDTADVVRRICAVASRKDLDAGSPSTLKWFDLDNDYRAEREHAGRNVR